MDHGIHPRVWRIEPVGLSARRGTPVGGMFLVEHGRIKGSQESSVGS